MLLLLLRLRLLLGLRLLLLLGLLLSAATPSISLLDRSPTDRACVVLLEPECNALAVKPM